jgi:acetyltransferase
MVDSADSGGLAQECRAALLGSSFTGEVCVVDLSADVGELARLQDTNRFDLAVVAVSGPNIPAARERARALRCRSIWQMDSHSRGFQRPHTGLNASVLGPLAAQGSLALVSQSGSLTAAVLDWARENGVGFSAVVSVGSSSGIELSDVLDFFASDRHTQSIVVYLEGIQDSRAFMSALRSAASLKPVVVLKAGRGGSASEVALTHSQAMVGHDEVFDAALRRAGAVRVRSFVQLFSAVRCLAVRYKPVGKRLGVVSNGGGPAVMAADWITQLGLELGEMKQVRPESFRESVTALMADSQLDGVLVIYTPEERVDASAVAQALGKIAQDARKPLLACWMGESTVREARHVLDAAGIPNFRTPEAAVEAFHNIARFHENQQLLQQIPSPLTELAKPDLEGARMLIDGILAEGRLTLSELESKALLAAFHIPLTQTILARSAREAVLVATQMGFPVALKIDSPDILHKSDVQGVVLNVMNASGVREVFDQMMERVSAMRPDARLNGVTVQRMAGSSESREVFIGLVTDKPFGPVLAFGAGGTMVELIQDRSMELPPLNQFLAQRMIERARILPMLQQWRGTGPVHFESLERILLRVSEMVCALPELQAIDINPIMVDSQGAIAVDARVVLQSAPAHSEEHGHLAIAPYPARYEQEWIMRDGEPCWLRPMHPDDGRLLQQLVQRLSPESRYFRFASSLLALPQSMLARLSLIDYSREMAMVALLRNPDRIIAVSRYITNPDRKSCEFSLLVDDEFAGRGLGSKMMQSIMEVARDRRLEEIDGLVLANNVGMLRLMRSLGFSIATYEDDPDFKVASSLL